MMTSSRSGSVQWLQPRLEQITARTRQHVLPEHRAALDRAQVWLADKRYVETAMQVGEPAGDFALPNQRGEIVRLSDRLATGPAALIFFRGDWCPYCQLTLQAWNRQLDRMRAAGGSVLAISPQTSEANAAMAEKLQLRIELLSDIGSEISDLFRLSYSVPDEMKLLYRQFGIRLSSVNGGDGSRLPMPATFLVDSGGTVRLADVQRDPARRLEPFDAIRVVRRLAVDPQLRAPRSAPRRPH